MLSTRPFVGKNVALGDLKAMACGVVCPSTPSIVPREADRARIAALVRYKTFSSLQRHRLCISHVNYTCVRTLARL